MTGLQPLVLADAVGDLLEQFLGIGDRLPLPLSDLPGPDPLALGPVGPARFSELDEVFLIGPLIERHLKLLVFLAAAELNPRVTRPIAETDRHDAARVRDDRRLSRVGGRVLSIASHGEGGRLIVVRRRDRAILLCGLGRCFLCFFQDDYPVSLRFFCARAGLKRPRSLLVAHRGALAKGILFRSSGSPALLRAAEIDRLLAGSRSRRQNTSPRHARVRRSRRGPSALVLTSCR